MSSARKLALAALGVVMAAAGWYVFVYLYRWEWNRAIVAGVIFLAAEVALLGSVLITRLSTLSRRLDGMADGPPAGPPDERVLRRDRAQGVFQQAWFDFAGKMITDNRLTRGRQELRSNADLFARIERETGVPGAVITAFWGLETDFGGFLGDFETLSALATLSLGAVLGPEAPLIAIGGGLAALTVRLVKRDVPPMALTIIASAGSFAAISTLLGSPLLGAFLIMEVAGVSGATLSLVALPGPQRSPQRGGVAQPARPQLEPDQRGEGGLGTRANGADRPGRRAPRAALRRAEAAGGARPRAGARAAAAAAGRAAFGPGRANPQAAAGRAEAAAAGDGLHRHPGQADHARGIAARVVARRAGDGGAAAREALLGGPGADGSPPWRLRAPCSRSRYRSWRCAG